MGVRILIALAAVWVVSAVVRSHWGSAEDSFPKGVHTTQRTMVR